MCGIVGYVGKGNVKKVLLDGLKELENTDSIEQKVKESGKRWEDFTLEELDRLWEEAKKRNL